MILAIGTIPFTEKLLMRTPDETFQIANTPQHRHSTASNNDIGSPILHLLQLMNRGIPGFSQESAASYMRLVSETLEAACSGRESRGSRLELLRKCASLCRSEAESQKGKYKFCQLSWKVTARFSTNCLCSLPIESARERDGTVSRDYENAVKILVSGFNFAEDFQEWSQLLDSLVRVLRTEKGDQAISAIAIEPLAECMMVCKPEDNFGASTAFFNHLMSLAYGLEDQAIVEKNAAAASGSAAETSRPLFPQKMIELTNKILRDTYGTFTPSKAVGIAGFLEWLTSFLRSGTYALRVRVLESLQTPLSLWLKDDACKLDASSGIESRILTAVCRSRPQCLLHVG